MKVLFLTSTLPRFAGDMQAGFVLEQAHAWLQARPDDDLRILAPHDAGIETTETIGGIRVDRFRYFVPASAQKLVYPAILPNLRRNPLLVLQVPPFLLAEYRAAARLVREERPDVVYAHWVMPQGVVAWLIKRLRGIPYVLQNHSSDLTVFLKAGAIGRRVARAVLSEAAHFFCVNAAQRDFALGLFEGAEREAFAARCTVLPMGVAGATSAPAAGGERFDIATIGRLSRKKGLNHLIEAAERLARRGIRPRIGIAGDGEDRALLQDMVKDADVTFPGFLTGEAKERFLAAVDRFAFPAVSADGDVEGLPVALLEALARGRPVLASRDTNIELLPEWPKIRNQVVFVENPADITALEARLERLLGAEPSETGAEAVSRYRWENLMREYLEAIDAALA